MSPKVSVPPGTLLPPAHTILWLRVSHQGQTHRLGPIQCARSFSCNDLKWRLTSRFGLHKERFEIIWLDDDNHQSDITDDASFFDAMEYFTPAAVSSTFTPASEQITSPTVSEGSSGSSDGNGTAVPSSTATSSPRATIEMHIQVKIFSRITLSDFAPSSAGSVSAGGNNRAWDSESESEAGESGVEYYEYGDDGDEWSQSNGSYPRHQHQHQQPSSSSSTSSQYRPPLNGKQRLASLHSYTEEQEEDEDDQGTEYAFSGASVNDNRRMFHGRSVPFDVTSPPTVHLGATCIVCGVKPIQGVRYICVMCHGVPSFCGSCEDAGRAIQHAPHLATHALLKLVEPLSSSSSTNTPTSASFDPSESSIASTLIRAAQALSVNRGQDQDQHHRRGLSPPGGAITYGHDVLCSFCSERIVDGPRYLCANCPLDLPTPPIHHNAAAVQKEDDEDGSDSNSSSSSTASPTPMILTPHEGFNLCSACEEHSLSIHDSDHFFLKIPGSASIARSATSGDKGITPLRLNPYLTIEHRTQGLLPSLYQDVEEDTAWADTQRRVAGDEQGQQAGMSGEPSSTMDVSPTNAAVLPRRPTIYEEMQLERRRLEQERRMAVDEVMLARERDASYPPLPAPSSSQPAPASATATPRNASPPSRDRPRQTTHLVSYIASLRHASLMCDLCFEPIQGCWLRCANCKHSFDICSKCEQEALEVHESNHTFAVFKRRVDLDLFKSLVDHVDSTADPTFGPGRAMIPFLLV